MKLLGITSVDCDVIGKQLRIFYIHLLLEKEWECNGTVRQLFIDFKKACGSFMREVLYSIVNEFGMPRKLVGLIKMCLNETHSRVHIGKNRISQVSYSECLEQGDALSL
jgi:hypothetical protein